MKLEAEVKAHMLNLIRREDLFDAVAARQQTLDVTDLETDVLRLRKVLDAFPDRKKRLFELYEKKEITLQEFRERRAEQQADEVRQRAALIDKESRLEELRSASMSRQRFEETLKDLDRLWDTCSRPELKEKLSSLIERIEIKDKTFTIKFRLENSVPTENSKNATER